METQVRLSMKQMDEDGVMRLAFYGIGTLRREAKWDIICYQEEGDPPIDVRLRISDYDCVLIRKAEHTTKIQLQQSGQSHITIQSEYGSFDVPVKTNLIRKEKGIWEIAYEMTNGLDRFHFLWEEKEG